MTAPLPHEPVQFLSYDGTSAAVFNGRRARQFSLRQHPGFIMGRARLANGQLVVVRPRKPRRELSCRDMMAGPRPSYLGAD